MPTDEKAAQKAVKALIKAISIPETRLSRIEINAAGTVKVFTRDHAYFAVAHVAPFEREKPQ